MTYKEAVRILSEAGIGSASYDARELFVHFGGFNRSEIFLSDPECDNPALIEAIERRAAREPLQYIIGEVEFYRESYLVTPDCLIPRADTEILVDYAVHNLPEGAVFLDLCTGSGCIAISTLKNTKNTKAIAADIDGGALAVATENAIRNGVADRLHLRRVDLMEEVIDEPVFAVLSNPPYVSESAYAQLEQEISHEPPHAFIGGADGGDFYRHLTPIYKDKITEGGFIAYEIGFDQAELIRIIAEECGMSCEILKDYGGRDRVAILRVQSSKCRVQSAEFRVQSSEFRVDLIYR